MSQTPPIERRALTTLNSSRPKSDKRRSSLVMNTSDPLVSTRKAMIRANSLSNNDTTDTSGNASSANTSLSNISDHSSEVSLQSTRLFEPASGIFAEKKLLDLQEKNPLLFFGQRSSMELLSESVNPDVKNSTSLHVEAATVKQLVNRLIGAAVVEPNLVYDLFLTYTNFVESSELLTLIKDRCAFLPPEDASPDEVDLHNKWRPVIHNRAANALRIWMECNPSEFRRDQTFNFEFLKYIQSEFQSTTKNLLMTTYESWVQVDRTTHFVFSEKAPESLTFNENSVQGIKRFSQCHPTELARQLSLYEWNILRLITPNELNNAQWTKSAKAVLAPNVVKLTDWFNRFSFSIARDILQCETPIARAKLIGFWIQVAAESRKMNNFNSAQEVVTALSMAFIHRLKKTWSLVEPSHMEQLEDLRTLLSDNRSYGVYRNELSNLLIRGEFAVLPFLGIHLRDILFLADGNPTFINIDIKKKCSVHDTQPEDAVETSESDHDSSFRLEDQVVNMINFRKQRLIGRVVRQIQQCQSLGFNFSLIPEISSLFESIKDIPDTEKLWSLSQSFDSEEKGAVAESPPVSPRISHKKTEEKGKHREEKEKQREEKERLREEKERRRQEKEMKRREEKLRLKEERERLKEEKQRKKSKKASSPLPQTTPEKKGHSSLDSSKRRIFIETMNQFTSSQIMEASKSAAMILASEAPEPSLYQNLGSAVPSLTVSAKGTIVKANEALRTFLGIPKMEDLIGSPMAILIPAGCITRREHTEKIQAFKSHNDQEASSSHSTFCAARNAVLPIRLANDSIRLVTASIVPVQEETETSFSAFLNPIELPEPPKNHEHLASLFRKLLSIFPVTHDFSAPSLDFPENDLFSCASEILRSELAMWGKIIRTFKTEKDPLMPFLAHQVSTTNSLAVQAIRDALSRHYKNNTVRDRAFLNLVIVRLMLPQESTSIVAERAFLEMLFGSLNDSKTKEIPTVIKVFNEPESQLGKSLPTLMATSLSSISADTSSDVEDSVFFSNPDTKPNPISAKEYNPRVGLASISNLDKCTNDLIRSPTGVNHTAIFSILMTDKTAQQLWLDNSLSLHLIKQLWLLQGGDMIELVIKPVIQQLAENHLSLSSAHPQFKAHRRQFKDIVKGFLAALNRSVGLIPTKTRLLFEVNPSKTATLLPQLYEFITIHSKPYTEQAPLTKDLVHTFFAALKKIANHEKDNVLGKWPLRFSSAFSRFAKFFATGLDTAYFPYPAQLVSGVKEQISKGMLPQFSGMKDPFSIHQPLISLYPKLWCWVRELVIIPHCLTRTQKEIVAIMVSKANQCAYCTQAHSLMLQVTEGKKVSKEITQEGKFDDPLLEQFLRAADERNKPLIQETQRQLDLRPGTLGEILGVMQLNHYFNKTSQVRLGDKMLPVPTFLFPTLRDMMASDFVLGKIVKAQHEPGISFSYTDYVPTSVMKGEAGPKVFTQYLRHTPDLLRAFSQLHWEFEQLEILRIPARIAKFLHFQLSFWNGEAMPMSTKWAFSLVSEALQSGELEPLEEKQALLALLTAKCPAQVPQSLKDTVQKQVKTTLQYTALTSWAAWNSSIRRMEVICQFLLPEE